MIEDLNFENFFFVSLTYGNAKKNQLVIAKNIKDTLETIKEEFEYANILAIISLQELYELDSLITQKPNLIFGLSFNENKDMIISELNMLEINSNVRNDEKQMLILEREEIKAMIGFSLSWLSKNNDIPLISKNMLL